MNLKLRIFLIIAMTIYTFCIYYFLGKRKFQLKYSFIWIFGGLMIWLCVIFPKQFNLLMLKLGVAEAMNGMFGICIFLIFIMLMFVTAIVSVMDSKLKSLIQKMALMEQRIRELEGKLEK